MKNLTKSTMQFLVCPVLRPQCIKWHAPLHELRYISYLRPPCGAGRCAKHSPWGHLPLPLSLTLALQSLRNDDFTIFWKWWLTHDTRTLVKSYTTPSYYTLSASPWRAAYPETIRFLLNLIKFDKKSNMCSENINFSWSSPDDDLKIAFYIIFHADFDFEHQRC